MSLYGVIRKFLPNVFKEVDVNYPCPVDGDAVYEKDINQTLSSAEGFTKDGEAASVIDLFNDLNSVIVNDSTDNPKTIIVKFKRTITTTGLAIGDTQGGTHSNLKIEAQRGSQGWTTLYDGSTSPIPFPSRFYSFSTTAGNSNIGVVAVTALRLTFNTANAINLSFINISKIVNTISTLQGNKPDGTTTFIGATNYDNLKVAIQEYGDTPAIDSFARLRTANPFTIFDSKQLQDNQPLFWAEKKSAGATCVHDPINAETKMTVPASAGEYAIRQTKQRFNYQPGKSQLVFMTLHSPQVSGITCRVGLFDDDGTGNNLTPNNGIFFECDGELSWNIAKNGTITETVTQDNWNVDPLDGTGQSGISLDMTDSQIMIIDYEWLGVGRVRVGFVIDGLIYYVHYFNHANNGFDSVYMSTPNLPLRYSIETDGTNTSHLDHICSTVISEGGVEKTGVLRAFETGDVYITGYTTGASYALLGLQLKGTHKDISVIPEAVNIVIGTSDSFKWTLELNPTVNNTFTYNDIANSSLQGAIGGITNTISARGLKVGSGGGSQQTRQSESDLETALRIGTTIAGVSDQLVLVFTPLSANINTWASINFRELL